MTEKEIWKSIEGYDGLYEVSNFGRVKGLAREIWIQHPRGGRYQPRPERILKPDTSSGHARVVLCNNGIGKPFMVSRLVANEFLENPFNFPIVIHLDGNTLNNYSYNLRWGRQDDTLICLKSPNRHKNRALNRNVQIKCLETNEIFPNVKNLVMTLNVTYNCVRSSCNNLQKTIRGKHYITCNEDGFNLEKEFRANQAIKFKNEIFKDIKGYEGLYQISNFGRIKKLPKKIDINEKTRNYFLIQPEKIFNGYIMRSGKGQYLRTELTDATGKSEKHFIQYLVADAFVKNDYNYNKIKFIDGNTLNCTSDNLEFVENNKTHASLAIRNIDTGEIFSSLTEAGKHFNKHIGALCTALESYRTRTWCGYHWEYVNS